MKQSVAALKIPNIPSSFPCLSYSLRLKEQYDVAAYPEERTALCFISLVALFGFLGD